MQRASRTYYVVGALFTTCLMAGSASAQDPQQTPSDQPSRPSDQPSKPSDMPSQPSDQPQAQDTSTPIEVAAARMTVAATVDKVDTQDRQLMLRDNKGNQFKVNVPEDVTRFDAIKKGDKVTVDFYSSVALDLKKGGEGAPSASDTEAAERVPGPLPGGAVARKISASAEVVKVDKAGHKVTLRSPEGEVDTIHVTDPKMQGQLDMLKKGDKIQASYTEAVAIEVTPKKKSKG
jgi:hypothetical protein